MTTRTTSEAKQNENDRDLPSVSHNWPDYPQPSQSAHVFTSTLALLSCFSTPSIIKHLALLFGAALAHTRAHLIVMLRRVLVVAGLAQLSRASSSLARTHSRHLLLASRSRPSASPLEKVWLHCSAKPLRCLSAADCFPASAIKTVCATVCQQSS